MTPSLFAILVTVAVLACALGAVVGFLYFRALNRERLTDIEAGIDEFAEQKHRHSAVGSAERAEGNSEELRELRVELEQKKMEYRLLKQDFELETKVLAEEIEELKGRGRTVYREKRRQADLAADLERQREELQASIRESEARRQELSRSWAALQKQHNDLDAERDRLRREASRMESEFMSLPDSRFSSRQEALLIKRLRQEIKQLRDELELLHARRDRAA